MIFKECNECTICCEGYLEGDSFGVSFGNLQKCNFLCKNKCLVYEERPKVCRSYFCAWKQGLFPDWMRPDKINCVISVEGKENQYLKVINKDEISENIKNEIENFAKMNNCEVFYIKLTE